MVSLPVEFLRIPLAHRGLHDRSIGVIENSLSAFSAAVAAGYGIELDLQMSLDDEVMVFHDYHLSRVTGESGAFAQRSSAELQQIELTGSTDHIPTLTEVLKLVAGKVPLLIEIKDQDGALGPDIGLMEARLAELLDGYSGPVAVISFNPYSVAAFARLQSKVAFGLTTGMFEAEKWGLLPVKRRQELLQIPDFEALGCSFISHDQRALDAAPVARVKATGAPILTWTVRSEAEEIQARKVAANITFENYLPSIPGD